MENVAGTRGIGERKYSLNVIFEKFVPDSGWTEDLESHYLLLDLPDFKKEELKLQIVDSGHVKVSGEREVSENKYRSFKETYKVPENSDIEKITGKFEDGILNVIVPKQAIAEKEEPENEINGTPNVIEEENEHEINGAPNGIEEENEHEKHNSEEDPSKDDDKHSSGHGHYEKKSETSAQREGFHEEIREEWSQEASQLDSVMQMLINYKHKWIVITAVLAFLLGVLVSQKFVSTGQ